MSQPDLLREHVCDVRVTTGHDSGVITIDMAEGGKQMTDWVDGHVSHVLVLNFVNRGMGKDDVYPFVLRPKVLEKLRFVHVVVTSYR